MDKMPATTKLFRLLWLLGLAAARSSPDCGGAVSQIADASLTKWISDTEANVSTGSYHVVLGGDRAAHGTALKCALRTAAKAAGAPPSAFSSILTIDCEGDDCADASWESLATYLKKRRGRYGVVASRRIHHCGSSRRARRIFGVPQDAATRPWTRSMTAQNLFGSYHEFGFAH